MRQICLYSFSLQKARVMEALLRLPENVAAAAAAAANKAKEATSSGSNTAPVAPLSILRRNQRFQIGFLESLQVVCRSISHLFNQLFMS